MFINVSYEQLPNYALTRGHGWMHSTCSIHADANIRSFQMITINHDSFQMSPTASKSIPYILILFN